MKWNVYSVPYTIYATAYIKAESFDEAEKIARDMKDTMLELQAHVCGEGVAINGRQYDDPQLPAFSLSPAMTLADPTLDCIELTEEGVPEGEEDENDD